MMNPSEPVPLPLIGHVRNGVIVLDGPGCLREGQAVRVEPLADDQDSARAERVQQLQQLFAEWTEEDGKLSDVEADRLSAALRQSGRFELRTPTLH